jgi:hypothetical protein
MLSPDDLHQLIKLFHDHVYKWCSEIMENVGMKDAYNRR